MTTTTIHSAQYHTFADIHTKSVTTRICHCITNFLTTTDRQSGILSPPNVGQSPLPAAMPRPACCRRPSYTTLQEHSPQEGKPAAHQGSREGGSTTPHDGGFDSGNAGCLLTKAGWDNPNSMTILQRNDVLEKREESSGCRTVTRHKPHNGGGSTASKKSTCPVPCPERNRRERERAGSASSTAHRQDQQTYVSACLPAKWERSSTPDTTALGPLT